MQDVDYEATLATKLSIAKKVFEQEKDLILNSSSFHKYFSENEVLQTYIFFFLWSWPLLLKYFDVQFELWSFFSLIILFRANWLSNVCFTWLQEWLKPYAAFCFLRDFFETSDHSQWGRFSCFTEKKVVISLAFRSSKLRLNIICLNFIGSFHTW